MLDQSGNDVIFKVFKESDPDTGAAKVNYITIEVLDEKSKHVTKTAFPVLDLIGAKQIANSKNMIEINVMPLDLRNS